MAGFEDLIRGALLKQGAPDAAGRQKVYDSARQALERMLESNEAMTPEISVAQRGKLEAAIADIESSYATPKPASPQETVAPAAPAVSPAAPAPPPIPRATPAETPTSSATAASARAVPPPVQPAVAPNVPKPARREPEFDGQIGSQSRTSPPRAQPASQVGAATAAQAKSGEYQGDVLKERKPYAKLLLWTIILVGLAVAAWWAITFGPGLLREQLDGSVPNPRPTLESGAFVPGDGSSDWVSVFVPDVNAADVVTNGGGAAELQRDGAHSVMRMASPDQSEGSNLLIKIPRGVMQDLQGQAATLELMVKSTNDESQEFVIYCQFKAMGNCGRKRFVMTSNAEPFIFDILVNDVFLQEGQDAYLAINTDFSGKGRAMDLYSIRVRIGS